MKRGILLLLLPALIGGCSKLEQMGLIKGENKVMPAGERESVLLTEETTAPAAAKDVGPVVLPKAEVVKQWHQAGQNAAHAVPHVQLAMDISPVWEAQLSASSNRNQRLLCEPIVADGLVMLYTPDSYVTAYDASTGSHKWSFQIQPEESAEANLGGGLAYNDGKLFVTTPFAELFAIEMKSGKPLWSAKTNSPLRSAPTVSDGRVYVVSLENELTVYDENTGKLLWKHEGVSESSGLLGGCTPSVHNGVVIVPYSSGEVYAIQADNGYPLWTETVSSAYRTDSIAGMPHIRAKPVIKDGVAYVVSQAGRCAAFDVRAGEMIWNRDFGGAETPVVAGDSLFMVTNDNFVICLDKSTGKIRWTKALHKWTDESQNKGRIVWNGPVLAGSRLFLTGSHGTLLALDAKDGSKAYEHAVSGSVVIPPIAVDGTVYVVTESGSLVALR